MAFGKFAKYTPDEISFNPTRFDLVCALRECYDYVAAEDDGVHAMLFEAVPLSRSIVSDPKHLRLIAINLLHNAIKYSNPGSAVRLDVDAGGPRPTFRVTDEGIGIPREALAQLFSPFYRASNVADRPGTGLGLAILKRSARILGATVDVESRIGEGTTFTIGLPA